MKTVLFLCSGNYYRSRFAEMLFNHLAQKRGLGYRAESRGLIVGWAGNIGPISQTTLVHLRAMGVPVDEPPRLPMQVTEADFEKSELVIAVKEDEHRQMMDDQFPAWTSSVQFWHIDDLDCATAADSLPILAKRVAQLVDTLAAATPRAAVAAEPSPMMSINSGGWPLVQDEPNVANCAGSDS